jgi:hypothetical protein
VITCPAWVTADGDADVTTVSAPFRVTGTLAVDDGEVTGEPDGGSPETVAESFTLPLSMSAWVTV